MQHQMKCAYITNVCTVFLLKSPTQHTTYVCTNGGKLFQALSLKIIEDPIC